MDFIVRPLVRGFEPNADVFVDEERGQLVVAVEIAGADPDSLRVSVDEHHLLIKGRRSETVRFRRGSFLQKEITYGEFSKRIRLPIAVEIADVTAKYADGVLVIALSVSQTAYLPTTRTEIRMIIQRTLS